MDSTRYDNDKYQIIRLKDDRGLPFYEKDVTLVIRPVDIEAARKNDRLVVILNDEPSLYFIREDESKSYWIMRPPVKTRFDKVIPKSEPVVVYEIIACTMTEELIST